MYSLCRRSFGDIPTRLEIDSVSTTVPCLTENELERFLLGYADEKQSATVECHLHECPTCQERIRTVGSEDELILVMRAVGSAHHTDTQSGLTDASPELVDLLVPHFRQLAALEDDTAEGAAARTDATASYDMATWVPGNDTQTDSEELERLGRYEIRGKLGRGGMGEVLHAFDPLLQRSVAIKVLQAGVNTDSQQVERLVREAQAAAAVEHDHIVPIFSVEIHHTHPCIVMPLLKGMSLHQHLEHAAGPLPLAEILRIGRETAEGLAAAHEHGLIHCDIKPANLWLEAPRDRVRILDFGLAIPQQEGQTERSSISGTPGYLAPEQARGLPLDSRADVFSLGCVLYRMATGQAPFTGEKKLRALWTVLAEPPTPASIVNAEIPVDLCDLIEQMMAREPEARPATARAVLTILDEISGRLTAARNRIFRRRWLAAMLCVGLLSGGGVGAWAMLTAPQPAKPVPVTLLTGAEPLAVKFRRDGQETPVTLRGETVVSLPPGEYTTHLVEEQPGRELLPRIFVVEDDRPQAIPVVLVGEIARQAAHSRPVTGVAVQSAVDSIGKADAFGAWSIGLDRQLSYWDGSPTAHPRFTPLPHEARCLCLSADGRSVATAGGNKQAPHELAIRIWDAQSLIEEQKVLEGHTRLIQAMAYAPDGQHLVSAAADGIFVWNLSSGEPALLPGSEDTAVQALAFSPDGHHLVTGDADGCMRVWSMQTRSILRSHVVGENPLRAVAWIPEGIAAGGEDGTVWTWVRSEEKPRALTVRPQGVKALAVAPAGDQLLIGDASGTIAVWSLASPRLTYEFHHSRGPVTALAFIGDGRRAVSGGADGTVRLWQLPLP